MNFPPDVISRAITISDELRQKQLPDSTNRSNVMLNNSSMNRRSTYRSTILETSTSEHSHLLRLFYNLYADMVAISQMDVAIEEKRQLLTEKMRELSNELPSHILEVAKNGNLFDIFKQPTNVPTNLWTPPEVVEDEPVQPSTSSQSLRNETDLSLLSQHSIVRRVNLDLQNQLVSTSFDMPQKTSNDRYKAPSQQQSKVHFLSDSIVDLDNPQLDDCFGASAFNGRNDSVAAASQFNDDDRNFNFLDARIDFIDDELTQYFSDMSPRRAQTNFVDKADASDFLIPDILNQNDKEIITASSGRPRSYQNTSTEAHPATSSKDYTKSKSSGANTSQRSSSSSSSGLFRLQLKSPLKKRDNRILKTPPKNTRIQSVPLNEFSFGTPKESTERRSTSRLSFKTFDDKDFSGVEIPAIPTSTSSDKTTREFTADDIHTVDFPDIGTQYIDDSSSQSFNLKLTQFFSRELPDDDSFFVPSQNCPTDKQQTFASLSDDIMPNRSTTQFSSSSNAPEDESFIFPDIPASAYTGKPKTNRYGNRDWMRRDESAALSDATCASSTSSQEESGNFFNLYKNSQNSSQRQNYKLDQPINQSYIRKVTVAPEITPPTGLQFLQYAYQNRSDDDSTSSDDDYNDNISSGVIRASSAKSATISHGNQKSSIQPSRNTIQGELTKSLNKIKETAKTTIISAGGNQHNVQSKSTTEAGRFVDSSTVVESQQKLNASISNVDVNVEDIILPVPPEFL